MGRWGEEESKTKGIGGCLFALFILLGTSWFFYTNYQRLENRRLLEKAMQDSIRTGYAKSVEKMRAELLDAAAEIGVELTQDDIRLSKELDDYNNPVVDCRIEYSFDVDLIVTTYPMNLPIIEKVTIVAF